MIDKFGERIIGYFPYTKGDEEIIQEIKNSPNTIEYKICVNTIRGDVEKESLRINEIVHNDSKKAETKESKKELVHN